MKIRAIITGASGMVGEGVLRECLAHPDVEAVLVVGRRPCGYSDPKLTEILHSDFLDLKTIEGDLKGYNACFFCLGVSSVGMKEPDYYQLTYTLTMEFARTVARINQGMTFCYISGAGTDSTGKGKLMWARVKGKTENDLMKLPFRSVYAFRPGFLKASKGSRNIPRLYSGIGFLYPVLKTIMPRFVTTLSELGTAMIRSVTQGYDRNVLEVPDILKVSG